MAQRPRLLRGAVQVHVTGRDPVSLRPMQRLSQVAKAHVSWSARRAKGSGRVPQDAAYLMTRSPTRGSAAAMCFPALPRTVL